MGLYYYASPNTYKQAIELLGVFILLQKSIIKFSFIQPRMYLIFIQCIIYQILIAGQPLLNQITKLTRYHLKIISIPKIFLIESKFFEHFYWQNLSFIRLIDCFSNKLIVK